MKMTGRWSAGTRSLACQRSSKFDGMRRPRMPTSLSMAPVQPEPVLERGRDAQPEHADQLGDRAGAARPGEDHDGLVVPADRLVDDPAGILTQPGGLQSGAAGLGVRVGVARQHLVADEVLDEGQCPSRGGVVGVRHPPVAVRRAHHVVLADHGIPDQAHQPRLDLHATQATRLLPCAAPRCSSRRRRRSWTRC